MSEQINTWVEDSTAIEEPVRKYQNIGPYGQRVAKEIARRIVLGKRLVRSEKSASGGSLSEVKRPEWYESYNFKQNMPKYFRRSRKTFRYKRFYKKRSYSSRRTFPMYKSVANNEIVTAINQIIEIPLVRESTAATAKLYFTFGGYSDTQVMGLVPHDYTGFLEKHTTYCDMYNRFTPIKIKFRFVPNQQFMTTGLASTSSWSGTTGGSCITAMDTSYQKAISGQLAELTSIQQSSKMKSHTGASAFMRTSEVGYWLRANCGVSAQPSKLADGSVNKLYTSSPACIPCVMFGAWFTSVDADPAVPVNWGIVHVTTIMKYFDSSA